jgi:hypothetical protein
VIDKYVSSYRSYAQLTSGSIDRTTLRPGETQIALSATISANKDISDVRPILGRRDLDYFLYDLDGPFVLEHGGNPQNGTWSGTCTVPSTVPDGDYYIDYELQFPDGSFSIYGFDSIRLQRATTPPDSTPPSITSPTIDPGIIQGTAGLSAFQVRVSATVRDNVRPVSVVAVGIPMTGSVYPQMSARMRFEQGDAAQNGTWVGTLAVWRSHRNGVYRINIYAFDAAGNLASTSNDDHPPTLILERTEFDNVPPIIVPNSSGVQPTTLEPEESEITLSLRATDNRAVQSVTAIISPSSPGSSQLGTTALQRSSGTTQDGTWTGRFAFPRGTPDGVYHINFRVVDVNGNSTDTTTNAPTVVTLLPRNREVTSTHQQLGRTIFTFPAPATVQSITSESGECVIEVSVRGRVIINCECLGK